MSIANSYTPVDIADMVMNITHRRGDYMEDLFALEALALHARETLSAAETARLEDLDARSEELDLIESDEYMTLYKRAHGE